MRLCYSNATEALLEVFVEDVAHLRAGPAGAFEPVHLVVPNQMVESYVKLGLARALGVAANIRVSFLRGFLAQVIEQSSPGTLVVDRPHVRMELLTLLHDEALLGEPEMAPVRAYLESGGTSADALDLRRVQLSAELATLFDEYAFSRPEMTAAWRAGKPWAETGSEHEPWQRRLWRALFADDGLLAARTRADGRPRVTTAGFFETPRALRVPPAVHVFGLSYVARLYRAIFGALAQATDLHVYTLNPCREYWEDLDTQRERQRAGRFRRRGQGEQLALGGGAGAFAAPASDENPLLELWGRPGRDNTRFLNSLADCDFEPRFVAPRGETLLARAQRDILDRCPPRRNTSGRATDESVRLLPCPDVRRELETIAAEIVAMLASPRGEGPALEPNDIAVIVPRAAGPRPSPYLTLAPAVFREAGLPHGVVDVPLGAESRVVEAFELLLALPSGPLARGDVLRLVTHPTVISRFPDASPADWVTVCELAGVFHGADRGDHADTYIDGDRFNWDQGLRRLALGAFLAGPRSGVERPFAIDGGAYLPAELDAERQASAASLGLLVRSLIADARFARSEHLSVPEWMAFLAAWGRSTICPASPDDEAALLKCLAALGGVGEMSPNGLRVGYRIARELAAEALAELGGRRGHPLADGITISSFLPMRAIPFRVIFIAGLGEGEFPSSDRPRALDLRGGRRQAGDVTPREQDEYMFLEALLSARERLVLSYVSRDALTGEALEKSPVLADLLEVLERGYLAGARATELARPVPLRRHQDAAARAAFPAAAREAEAARLGAELRARAGGGELPPLRLLREALEPAARATLDQTLGVISIPPTEANGGRAPAPGAPARVISLAQLRRFLECPLQGSARVLLGLRDREDEGEAVDRDDEPLEAERLHAIPLMRDVFAASVTGRPLPDAPTLARLYEERVAAKALAGNLPAGAFGEIARAADRQTLEGWRAGLAREAPILEGARSYFGGADEHEQVPSGALRPPLVFEIELPEGRGGLAATRVELRGKTELVARVAVPERGADEPAEARALVALIARESNSETADDRDLLRIWLTQVALAAAGDLGAQRETTIVFCRSSSGDDPAKVDARRLAPISAEDARAYLRDLVGDLLAGPHPYLLPYEAVFAWRKRPQERLVDQIAAVLDGRTRPATLQGPVSDARSYPIPPEADAQRLVERRFGPLFARLSETPSTRRKRKGAAS